MLQSYQHCQTDKQKLSPEKVTDYACAKGSTPCLNILLIRQLQDEPFREINEAEWCLQNPSLENMEARL